MATGKDREHFESYREQTRVKHSTSGKEERMKRPVKSTRTVAPKRELFTELTEGMDALADARHGKRTLRTHSMEFKPARTVTPQEPIRVRKNPKLMKGNS